MRRHTPASRRRRHARLASAFSLVEVLIAVLVLALGLLGLGAVFPMVMREQRIATQTTLGITAQNAAQQMLFTLDAFSPGGTRQGWRDLREYANDYVRSNGLDTRSWVPVVPVDDLSGPFYNAYALPDPADPSNATTVIPLSQRLYPVPYSTAEEPRFVWDIAVRVLQPNDPGSPIEVALFLRPIDPGIRTSLNQNLDPPRPYSIASVLLDDRLPGADRRNPVSVSRDGRPTLDGTRSRRARYATPVLVEAQGAGIDPDVIDQLTDPRVLSGEGTQDNVAGEILFVPGQQFIDRNGVLRTVTSSSLLGGRERSATFTPPVTDTNGDNRIDGDDYNPVLFLPLAPAVDPVVFTINP